MKTATVRDLRNRFADVSKWIADGEQVSITRNGKAFATLSAAQPEKPRKSIKKLWAERMKTFQPVGRKLSKAETEAFWSALRD